MSAVILPMLHKAARKLLSIPGVPLRRDTSKDAELLVLHHENAVNSRPQPPSCFAVLVGQVSAAAT